ncbi:MAG: hypothetical protein IT562_18795 [Alphaproteobacteria bacterium]|nr:hypothetical protein [Alphaproteobacteria bacterium]
MNQQARPSAAEIEAYRADGAVVLRQVFARDWIDSLGRGFAARWTGDDAVFAPRKGYMSPPPPATGGPEPGGPMDSDAFPVIWRAA